MSVKTIKNPLTFLRALLVLLLVSSPLVQAEPEEQYARQWRSMINKQDIEKARMLCENWLRAKNTLAFVQAHRCLAKVNAVTAIKIYRGNVKVDPKSGKSKQLVLNSHIEDALQHWRTVQSSLPNDIAIHKQRINFLNAVGRNKQAVEYLKEGIDSFTRPNALNYWLAIVGQLEKEKRYALALRYLAVLDATYEENYKIVVKTASVLMASGDEPGAVVYLRKAVAMAPKNLMNYIYLARHYELTGKIVLAENNYARALKINKSKKFSKTYRCEFGQFLVRYNRKIARACRWQKKYCAKRDITGCGAENAKGPGT